MARKLGKLPYDRISGEYALEYGTNTVEMHVGGLHQGQKAYIVSWGVAACHRWHRAAAAARLVERLGARSAVWVTSSNSASSKARRTFSVTQSPLSSSSNMTPKLVAVMGTTASGKTELAEQIAEYLDAQLVNADAFQIYRGMDIGPAKPEQKENAGCSTSAIRTNRSAWENLSGWRRRCW